VRHRLLLALLLLAASACGGGASSSSGAQKYTVLVDGYTPGTPVAFSAFFPKVVRIHAGDTVVFHPRYSGLPHTVALGRAVDTALVRLQQLADNDPAALSKGPPPEYAALPRLLPAGPGDANQAAAQPCVVAGKATIPTQGACPLQTLGAFDGSQQLASSGWLGAGQSWSVHFAKSTKPGTYRFLCQVHGPDMSGSVQVVGRSTAVKDPAAVIAEGRASREASRQRVQPGFSLLQSATVLHPLAGSGDPAAGDALITAFSPQNLIVPVGGTLSWTVIGTHSIAFNAPRDAIGLRREADDGTAHLSERAELPAGGPGAGPSVQRPRPVIDGGSWDGTGFRSSGLIFGPPPPNTTQFRLRFTKAGSYGFLCTVHVGMTGTVTVR
jgi:plastocyanin